MMKLKTESLTRLLRPIVRLWLRDAESFQEFVEAAKQTFVDVAREQLERDGHKINVSRLALATGLHRADVKRIYLQEKTRELQYSGIASRVLGQWEQDARFLTKSGAPKILSATGERNEFVQLVESVTTAVNPATVLFQLQRIGSVEKTARGLRLIKREALFSADAREAFEMIAENIESQVAAGVENLEQTNTVKNVYIRTDFNNIDPSELPTIRRWLLKKSHDFHRSIRNYLAKYDQDMNPRPGRKGGAKLCVSSFSLGSTPESQKSSADDEAAVA
ncbi:MAG: hypothetical protein KDD66_15635 [Bdellovibrionales bacterium]|nr:hypothetical protein [Bdellovibrionales bacterium]